MLVTIILAMAYFQDVAIREQVQAVQAKLEKQRAELVEKIDGLADKYKTADAEGKKKIKADVLEVQASLGREFKFSPLENFRLMQFGFFKSDDWEMKVLSVVDDGNMLLSIRCLYQTPVVQRGVLVGMETVKGDPETIWVSGVSTKNAVDGKSIGLSGYYHIAATKKYRAVSGAEKTVFDFSAIDIADPKPLELPDYGMLDELSTEDREIGDELAAYEKRRAEERKKDAEKQAAFEAEFHEWTSADGKFKVTARLETIRNDKVTMLKKDESTITVSIDKLSDIDKEYIEQVKKTGKR